MGIQTLDRISIVLAGTGSAIAIAAIAVRIAISFI